MVLLEHRSQVPEVDASSWCCILVHKMTYTRIVVVELLWSRPNGHYFKSCSLQWGDTGGKNEERP